MGLLRRVEEREPPAGAGAGPTEAPPPPDSPELAGVKTEVRRRLVERFAEDAERPDPEVVRRRVAELVDSVLQRDRVAPPETERKALVDSLLDDVLGLGPLEPLLRDESITEIMVNGPDEVFVEREGRLSPAAAVFTSPEQLTRVIDRIVSPLGRRVDESTPMVDARLPDGSRVNVIIPPVALGGPFVTIRKFSRERLEASDLQALGSLNEPMLGFLRAAVLARLNILVSGGTSSGKTTLLNVLSGFIPGGERIVTIEDAAELQLPQRHVLTLEARPPNVEGKGEVTIRSLVRNALRMRPDRIVVGEVRGAEALDMLQAMNTGHDGSMSTLHANSPADAVSRLETMALMAGTELPTEAVRKQIASAVNLVVHMERVQGGRRKVVAVTELAGVERGEIRYHDVFRYQQTGVDAAGDAIGTFAAPDGMPLCADRCRSRAVPLDPAWFC